MRHPLIKTFMVLMAALFFTVQGVSQAHAASYADDDHTHDGIACDVMLMVAEKDVLTPPAIVPSPFSRPERADYVVAPSTAAIRSFDSRAPPPRGPPL